MGFIKEKDYVRKKVEGSHEKKEWMGLGKSLFSWGFTVS